MSYSTFELLDWSVAPLNHEKIIDTTGGLYCFSGQGQDWSGVRPWSVVFKEPLTLLYANQIGYCVLM